MSTVGVIVALVLNLMIVLAGASPALAQPPGQNTVAEWRWFLDEIERRYDARARRTVEVQTVEELRIGD